MLDGSRDTEEGLNIDKKQEEMTFEVTSSSHTWCQI
jgi:hypothetical protein